MTRHTTWTAIKARRGLSASSSDAYRRAEHGIELGLSLYELRESLGITQAQLAGTAGLVPDTIDMIETGGSGLDDTAALGQIIDALATYALGAESSGALSRLGAIREMIPHQVAGAR